MMRMKLNKVVYLECYKIVCRGMRQHEYIQSSNSLSIHSKLFKN